MSNHKIEIRRSNVEKILLGAEKVFAEKGFAGTAMADIAAEVELPRSNLHYYFSTKTELYNAVLLGLLEVWKQDALCFETYDDPRLVLSSYIRAKMTHSRTRPYGSKVWADEIIHGAPTLGLTLDASLYDWAKNERSQNPPVGGRQTDIVGRAVQRVVHDLGFNPALRRLRSPGEHHQRASAVE